MTAMISPSLLAGQEVGKRWALLIGVNDYIALRPLFHCVDDMQALRDQLVTCGFPSGQVYLLRDHAENAARLPTKRNIERQLKLLLSLVREKDLVVVAFAGHGVQLGNKSYWCPSEAEINDDDGDEDARATLVSLDDVYEQLEQCPAALRLIVVDACRNDPRRGRSAGPALSTDGLIKSLENPPEGILVFNSCSQGQTSQEDAKLKHGVFVHFLLEGLKGQADRDLDRRISLGELWEFAGDRTQKYVADNLNDFQQPKLKGELTAATMRFPITPLLTLPKPPSVVPPPSLSPSKPEPSADIPQATSRISGPTAEDRRITLAVTNYLRDGNITRHDLDDEIAARLVQNFLKLLDPQKIFFYQADIDSFNKHVNELDDSIRRGNVDFAFETFNVFFMRVDERIVWAEKLLAAPLDFAAEETYFTDPQSGSYSQNSDAAADAWRRRIKFELLALRTCQGIEGQAAIDRLSTHYRGVRQRVQEIDHRRLLEMYLSALAMAYDPRSKYRSPESNTSFGATGAISLRDGEYSPFDVFQIATEDEKQTRSEILEQERNGKKYKIGYILLPNFELDLEAAKRGVSNDKSTTRDVAGHLQAFRSAKVDAVLLDLRDNYNGTLTEPINLTGLFIDEGPVVQVKDKDGNSQQYNDLERGTAWDGPLVVLVNKHSSAGSEIVAGAIQDYGRGLVIGDPQTNGKGTTQNMLELGRQLFRVPNAPDLGNLRLTMQQIYRPNGDSLQSLGVQSDIVIPSVSAAADGEADQEFAIPFDRITSAQFKKVADLRAIINQLRETSKRRCAASPEFQRIVARVEQIRQRKELNQVSLKEEVFSAEVNALKSQHQLDFSSDNICFKEAIEITLDYLQSR